MAHARHDTSSQLCVTPLQMVVYEVAPELRISICTDRRGELRNYALDVSFSSTFPWTFLFGLPTLLSIFLDRYFCTGYGTTMSPLLWDAIALWHSALCMSRLVRSLRNAPRKRPGFYEGRFPFLTGRPGILFHCASRLIFRSP